MSLFSVLSGSTKLVKYSKIPKVSTKFSKNILPEDYCFLWYSMCQF